MSYPVLTAETHEAHNGDKGEAYYARPSAPGKYPGVVLIHHMPGWDEWSTEAAQARHHGFATIGPHLYFRDGPGELRTTSARACARRAAWRTRR
jgi:carboxymethylenebutenolidase